MQTEVKRWGNSAAVRLPAKVLAQANLDVDSPICIEVVDGKIVIEAQAQPSARFKLPFSEEQLLSGLDAHTAHADALAQPSAAERGD